MDRTEMGDFWLKNWIMHVSLYSSCTVLAVKQDLLCDYASVTKETKISIYILSWMHYEFTLRDR